MTREEMIETARTLRSRDRFGPMTPEEIAALPGTEKELYLQTDDGKTVHVYIIGPEELESDGNSLLLNFHGGGFVKGRADRDRRYCAELADRLKCIVWDVDYCLAPENPFPSAFEECAAITAYAFCHGEELGIDTSQIAVAGHSAGGNLAVGVVLKGLQTGAYRPCCALMEYFPANHSIDPLSRYNAQELQDERNLHRGETERLYAQFYVDPDSPEAKSVFASPILADEKDLADFPDSLVISAGHDSLRDETEQFAQKLMRSGATVTAKRIPEAMHGFTVNRTDGWERAVALHEKFFSQYI